MAFKIIWKTIFFLTGFPLFVTLVASQDIVIEKSGGITVIKNPSEPIGDKERTSKLTYEEELSIRSVPQEGKPVFFDLSAVRADDDGNIYILDPRAGTIHVFNKSGEYLRDIGRRGQGPGELEMPVGLQVLTSMKSLIVTNPARLSYFSFSGEFHKHINHPWRDPVPQVDSRGDYIVRRQIFLDGKAKEELVKYDQNMNEQFVIAQIEKDGPNSGKKINFFPARLSFSVRNDDNIVWGITTDYALTIVDSQGKIEFKIEKEYKPIKISDEDKKKIISERFGGRAVPVSYEMPDHYPPYRDIRSDDTGKIYVGTYEFDQTGQRYYDIFDEGGRYVAKLAFPSTPLFIKNNRFYCVLEDKDGNQTVTRYLMKWK